MIRTPNPPDTLIRTPHRLNNPLQLLSTRISQQLRLLQDLLSRKIPHANSFFSTVDVVALYYRVFARPGGDGDFDLRIRAGEGWEVVFEKEAVEEEGSVIGLKEAVEWRECMYFMPLELPAQSQ